MGLAVVGSRAEASAFNCTAAGDRCYINVRWENRVVPYMVRLPATSRISPSLMEGAARRAFDRWNAVRCSDLEFVFEGFINGDTPVAGANEIFPVTSGWTAAGRDPLAAALTVVTFGSESGQIRAARVEVNEEFHGFTDVDDGGCVDAFDLEAVLTHEAGHVLGLAHPCEFRGMNDDDCPVPACETLLSTQAADAPQPTMWPVSPTCDRTSRSLETDDVEGLCLLYPASQPGRPCFPLPAQTEPYVTNQPFGCGAMGRQGATTAAVFWALVALGYCGSSRRRPGDQSVSRSVRVSKKRASR